MKPCCSVRLRNPLPRAIGYRLGRHSLKVEELGSTPTGATNSRAWGNCEPVQHAGLNPVPLPVRLRPSSPSAGIPTGRGNRSRSCLSRVRSNRTSRTSFAPVAQQVEVPRLERGGCRFEFDPGYQFRMAPLDGWRLVLKTRGTARFGVRFLRHPPMDSTTGTAAGPPC